MKQFFRNIAYFIRNGRLTRRCFVRSCHDWDIRAGDVMKAPDGELLYVTEVYDDLDPGMDSEIETVAATFWLRWKGTLWVAFNLAFTVIALGLMALNLKGPIQ